MNNEDDSYQLPEQVVEIKSKINEDVTCITFYQDNEWKILFKYKDQFLPLTPSKIEIYSSAPSRDDRLADQLLIFEITEDKNVAKRIILEIQSLAFQRAGAISKLKEKPKLEIEETKELNKEEREKKEKNKIITTYGEVVCKKSVELIREGKAQRFIIDKHLSMCANKDDKISWALSCVFASTHLLSSNTGEHLKLSGDSGKGKSENVNCYTTLTYPSLSRLTTPTGKNLFYNEDIHAGMVIIIDEWENSDETLVRAVKLSTSQFQEETISDVVINFKSEPKVIPPRIAFILMSVSQLDSTELLQRFTTADMPNDEQYLKDINKKQKGKASKPSRKKDKPDFDTQVCRCIYSILNLNVYDIIIPFANVIEWNDIDHTRNWELFADLIRCSAYYNILNRERMVNPYNENEISYLATYEDYENAIETYNKLAGNNTTKLSNNELKTIHVLMDSRKRDIEAKMTSGVTVQDVGSVTAVDEITDFGGLYISTLVKEVGVSETTIRNIIHGPKNNGGLLEKVVGIHNMRIAENVNGQIHYKEKVWYDGPEYIVIKVPKISRDICETETNRMKGEIIRDWNVEAAKWNVGK